MHWGEQSADKLWLFINPRFNVALCSIIRQRLDESRAKGKNVPHGAGYFMPLHHKNMVLTPAFLMDNGSLDNDLVLLFMLGRASSTRLLMLFLTWRRSSTWVDPGGTTWPTPLCHAVVLVVRSCGHSA